MSDKTEAKAHKRSWPIFRVLFSRLTLFIVFLLIQIAILWFSFNFLNEKLSYGFFIALSALEIIIILNQEGSSLFKIAWIVPIMLAPVFGGLLYVFIRIQTTVKKMRHRLDQEVIASRNEMLESREVSRAIKEEGSPELSSLADYLYGFCGFPAYKDTEVRFFKLGEDFFPVFCEELKKAEHFIFLEYFIVSKGEIWDKVLSILTKKAKEGVEIRFMYDGTNAIKNLPFRYDEYLKSLGIDAKIFSPMIPALASYQNNRDHRKICVIDGVVAFTGGLNLADEYANINSPYGVWKDTAAMFKGSAANSFSMLFLQMWNSAHGRRGTEENGDIKKLPYRKYGYDVSRSYDRRDKGTEAPGFVIPYGDSPLDNENIGLSVYTSIINEARDYVHIMTPYLILDDSTMSALCYAAKRGVDVKILFPHIPDKPYAFWLGHTYYKELIQNGVRIFEYLPGFVHAKEFISDGRKAVIGSINLDFRSLYLHFENAVYMYGVPAIDDMEKDFNECLKDCVEIDMQVYEELPKLKLLLGGALKVFAPLF